MPTIEIVIYIPDDMDEFTTYCSVGKPDGQGDYMVDNQGRKITGVIRWLLGRGVREAHFFNSGAGDDVNLFAATIERRENFDVPWMLSVPGFEEMVSTEGFVGTTSAFKPISELLAAVKTNTVLDQKFQNGRRDLNTILARIKADPNELPSISRLRLLAALRGESASNPAEVFESVRERFQSDLFNDLLKDHIRD